MREIFICEDDDLQRKRLEKIIVNYILIEELEMKIELSTANPHDIIGYLRENKNTMGIYFLGIHLNAGIDGIELAEKIRKSDGYGCLVFLTSSRGREAKINKVFEYRVEALDYIEKDDEEAMAARVLSCIDRVQEKHNQASDVSNYFVFSKGRKMFSLAYDSIVYVTIDRHADNGIELYTDSMKYNYTGTLKKIAEQDARFFSCNKDIVVNLDHVREIDSARLTVKMKNGAVLKVAKSRIAEFRKNVENRWGGGRVVLYKKGLTSQGLKCRFTRSKMDFIMKNRHFITIFHHCG